MRNGQTGPWMDAYLTLTGDMPRIEELELLNAGLKKHH
jgi:hypothetical protein